MYLNSIPDRSSSGQPGRKIEIQKRGAHENRAPLFAKIVDEQRKRKYNVIVVHPIPCNGKGVCVMQFILSFLVSVMADVVGYYIRKWLDRDNMDN